MNDIRVSFAARFASLKQELEANRRLRVLLYAVAAVGLFYLVLVASDFRRGSASAYAGAQRQLSRLAAFEETNNADAFEQRLTQETMLAERFRSWFWTANTTGLAVADFQAWLQSQAADAGIESTRLKLSELHREDQLREPVWKLEVELSAQAKSEAVVTLLAALAQDERRVMIQRIRYSKGRNRNRNRNRNQNRLSLLLVAYFQIDEPAEAPS
ncbi:MAG: GspMb/PilO family protein [Pseudomonadota bacterium]